ncbi:hydroxysqualene dehydroxylase HpnE [Novosphingobium sp.]|uniref:hydroxysqualene dehydroxylase HpnE n=1 Tax=Novosphingobium sp. TaxID=1874826 RepID=UPI00345332C4
MKATVIGAGLAGLSAAIGLVRAGVKVRLVDAAPRAGGRCRSYYDAPLGQVIDNGNHFVFSGNQAVQRYCATIGSQAMLHGPDHATFAFHDLRDDARWTLAVNDGPLPLWMLDPKRRAPGTTLAGHLALARLALVTGGKRTIGDMVPTRGAMWERVIEPMMLAVLNCPPEQGSARLAGRFLRESFVRGGKACRTMVALPTLDAALIDPALAWLARHGVKVEFSSRLREMGFDGDRVAALDFGKGPEPVEGEAVILAVPPWVAGALVPGLTVPDRFCAIVNAHFAVPPPPGAPMITALLGAKSQWVVCHADRISVTISGADDLVDQDREALARQIWGEVTRALGLGAAPLPAWQVVKEKRATFAATPDQDARRPGTRTHWRNLLLAGDWTQTDLPATIEGALRSGETAAGQIIRRSALRVAAGQEKV